MTAFLRSSHFVVQYLVQRLAMVVFALAAIGLVIATTLGAMNLAPRLVFTAQVGDVVYTQAGWYAQVGLTVLAVLLCAYLPANTRVLRLENSHRRFNVGMDDVSRAYALAHSADREGVFQLSSEFDAVRERLAYLRKHPDLETHEPQLLEMAAQMSHISRELAEVYSEEKVERARGFLLQRQQEVETFNSRIDRAKQVTSELKHWLHEVELEESVAASQLDRLKAELRELLPDFGRENMQDEDGTIVPLPPQAAE